MSTQEDGYNLVTSMNALKSCIRNDGVSIDLIKFLIGYKELIK